MLSTSDRSQFVDGLGLLRKIVPVSDELDGQLRAMYFLLANAKERFHYLSHALGGVLIFVGTKMTVAHWFHLDTYVSLAVIVTMLSAAVVASRRRA